MQSVTDSCSLHEEVKGIPGEIPLKWIARDVFDGLLHRRGRPIIIRYALRR